jgi:hypothetical protein
MVRTLPLVALAAGLAVLVACSAPAPQPVTGGSQSVGAPVVPQVTDFEFTDIDGRTSWLSDLRGSKATVVVMRDAGCPVSSIYGPRLGRMDEEFTPRGVTFLYLNTNSSNTLEEIRTEEIAKYGFKGRYIHDPKGRIGSLLDARSTGEVFVFDASRRLRYRGPTDDQYGVDYRRAQPRQELLRAALESVLAGRPVERAELPAEGCVLEFEREREQWAGLELPVSYHRQVSRIVQEHCQVCHRSEGIAPFALETFEQVHARRAMIRLMTKTRRMPPWFAHRDVGEFANDRSLPEKDLYTLLRWIDEGAPEGNRADAPPPRQWASNWQIGHPDAIVRMPEPFTISAEGVVEYQYFYVKTDFPEDRWIEKMELRPGAQQQVHHALVFIEEPGRKAGAEWKPGDPPFQQGGNGFFAGYAPGYPGTVFPEGTAKKLPKGAWLKFQMHYTTNGTAAVDQTELGFVFARQTPEREVETRASTRGDFVIPPGAPNHPVTAERTFRTPGTLISLFPHMHIRGKAFRMELVRPDGTVQPLLEVPRYDFNWQIPYVLREPIELAAGSKLRATGWFDNSAENPGNPDPTQEVRFGEQSWDEMMIGYFDWIPAAAPPAAGGSQ